MIAVVGRGGVGAELATELCAGGAEALTEHRAVGAVVPVALPHDHKSAARRRSQRGAVLVAGSGRIDLKLAAGGVARRIIALGKHAVSGTVGAVAIEVAVLPGDDETAVGRPRHVG